MQERWREETDRVLEELRRLQRAAGLTQRAIEERAGFSRGYLSQLLARNLDLKLWHVLAVLDALGHDPGDFFRHIYPGRRRFPALEHFQDTSQTLSSQTTEILGRLYGSGVESLNELRERLSRCEKAVEELEALGILGEEP